MLRIVWSVLLSSGVLMLLVTIVLAFSFRVFYLIGEVTGKNAKKQYSMLKVKDSPKIHVLDKYEESNEEEKEDASTTYMEDFDAPTSYIKVDLKSFIDSKHVVEIIKEQTSLFKEDKI